jgi:hypothetical protein
MKNTTDRQYYNNDPATLFDPIIPHCREQKNHITYLLKKAVLLLGIVTCVIPASAKSILNLIETKSSVVTQSNCPIKIKEYRSKAVEDDSIDETYGILHGLIFRNEGMKLVVAVRFRMIAVNAVHEVIGVHDAWHLAFMSSYLPQVSEEGEGVERAIWLQQAHDAFAFQHGLVFVDKVAFSDGSVWSSSQSAVIEELGKHRIRVSSSDLLVTAASPPLTREYVESYDITKDTFFDP